MDGEIPNFLKREKADTRPLIISGCHHGVTESWGFKEYLREIPGFKKYNVIARGAEPTGKPKLEHSSRRVIGVELQVEEISQAVLMLIHHTKLGIYRQRFGNTVLENMRNHGYLEVREAPRFWHLSHVEEIKKHLTELLRTCLSRKPLGVQYPDFVIELLRNDAIFQKEKTRREDKRRKKRSS